MVKFYEVFASDDFAAVIRANRKPSREQVLDYLAEHFPDRHDWKNFTLSLVIFESTEEFAYALYNMEFLNTLPTLNI